MTHEGSLLYTPRPPWIVRHQRTPESLRQLEPYYYRAEGKEAVVRVLRGRRMATTSLLMQEFAAAFQFFEGFGENWYALKDCLWSLDEWLPAQAYILVITSPELALSDEDDSQRDALTLTLREAGEWWSQPIVNNGPYDRQPVPFHTVLEYSWEELSRPHRFSCFDLLPLQDLTG